MGHDHQPMVHPFWTQKLRKTKRGYLTVNVPRVVLNGGSWGYGQKPPSSDDTKLAWAKASKVPGQSWIEGKNYRPEAPDNPYLVLHIDFGNPSEVDTNRKGRPAGIDLEPRWRANRHYLGDAA